MCVGRLIDMLVQIQNVYYLWGYRVVLDPWDRRNTDANSYLASTFLLFTGEGEKQLGTASESEGVAEDAAVSESEGVTEDVAPVCPCCITECREMSIMHYLECGRILGGSLGKLYGVDP